MTRRRTTSKTTMTMTTTTLMTTTSTTTTTLTTTTSTTTTWTATTWTTSTTTRMRTTTRTTTATRIENLHRPGVATPGRFAFLCRLASSWRACEPRSYARKLAATTCPARTSVTFPPPA